MSFNAATNSRCRANIAHAFASSDKYFSSSKLCINTTSIIDQSSIDRSINVRTPSESHAADRCAVPSSPASTAADRRVDRPSRAARGIASARCHGTARTLAIESNDWVWMLRVRCKKQYASSLTTKTNDNKQTICVVDVSLTYELCEQRRQLVVRKRLERRDGPSSHARVRILIAQQRHALDRHSGLVCVVEEEGRKQRSVGGRNS